MKFSFRKVDMLNYINMMIIDLPTPSSISYMWSFGSLLGLFLLVQFFTGIFLSIHYSCDVFVSFDSIIHLVRDVNYGWLGRVVHSNGASIYFMLLYIHIGRGLYYGSYRYMNVWLSGVSIFLISMIVAFLGYVLPWGQMSFWAATVITNLLSALPYFGIILVDWVWGGFSVGNSTLTRFFTFHFLFPFIVLMLVMVHLYFLHKVGSLNFFGLMYSKDKLVFYPYFVYKDFIGFFLVIYLLFYICISVPYIFMDVENFILANSLVTPVHIQPEWYFLFAYAILRSISSKIGGVLALVFSVLLLYLFPFLMNFRIMVCRWLFFIKFVFWFIVVNMIILTWLGAVEVIYPYDLISCYFSFLYFFLYFIMFFIFNLFIYL